MIFEWTKQNMNLHNVMPPNKCINNSNVSVFYSLTNEILDVYGWGISKKLFSVPWITNNDKNCIEIEIITFNLVSENVSNFGVYKKNYNSII